MPKKVKMSLENFTQETINIGIIKGIEMVYKSLEGTYEKGISKAIEENQEFVKGYIIAMECVKTMLEEARKELKNK